MKPLYLALGILIAIGALLLLAMQPSKRAADNLDTDLISAARASLHEAGQTSTQFGKSLAAASRKLLEESNEVTRLFSRRNQQSNQDDSHGLTRGTVEKGDTIASILEKTGVEQANQYANAAYEVFNPRSFKAGQGYIVERDPDNGEFKRFEYEISDLRKLVVEGGATPKGRIEDLPIRTALEVCEGTIDESLFEAVADIGENPALALKLVDLFGSEINFIRNIQEGDSFRVLIEKRYHDGEFRGYGRILAARFTNRGKTYEAWTFREPEGGLSYYNARGENLEKAMLMAPLSITRLSSKFTHTRRHPILGGIKPHLGVDYAAPTGTPVKAVGNGTVTERGWNGGYGNQIVLKHGAGLESMYSHLSGYAPGIRPGQKVKQGQVIGFVGSTGMSTGPHLDFRVRQDGKFINPAKAINPRSAPVDASLMQAFKKSRDLERVYLDGEKSLPQKYDLDKIVPAQVSLPIEKRERYSRALTKKQVRLIRALEAQKQIIRKNLGGLNGHRHALRGARSGFYDARSGIHGRGRDIDSVKRHSTGTPKKGAGKRQDQKKRKRG